MMEPIEGSETSAFKPQTPGKYPKENILLGKYSFVNRTIKSWDQLHAGLLASLSCKLGTFRKGVRNVVTGKGTEVKNVECRMQGN